MNTKNKEIINEYLLLNNAFRESLQKMGNNDGYAWYNENNKDWYFSLSKKYATILGIQNIQTEQEAISICSNMELTLEQKIALKKVKREPMFKKLMGETALLQKSELETLLGHELTANGMTYADENGPRVSIKSLLELDKEEETYNDILDKLFIAGKITEEQHRSYGQQLFYIYNYFMSISKGEQIPFRKLSDAEIKIIQNQAEEEGLDFHTLLTQINAEKMEDFQEFQDSIHKGK